jgi:CheY-like chemotaxis protein
VYGIVKQLDGGIAVESEPGIGTTFTIYFPLIGADAPAVEPRVRLEGRALDRRRILLVEDDDSVRTLTRRMLERAGYDVVPAANGEEALGLFATATEPIALVLTDVVMPGLSGPEMLERMLLERAVPALLISGYPDQGAALEARCQFRLVPKPFTADALVSAIRETLDAAAGSVA